MPPALDGAGALASPFAEGPVLAAARRVRETLTLLAATAGQDPWWARRFWLFVWGLETQNALPPALKFLLSGFGYIGEPSSTAPRTQELTDALRRLEAQTSFGAVSPSAGASSGKWAVSLPPDFRRAGMEIYRNIMGEGVNTIREWLMASWTGTRASTEYSDAWLTASNIDFRLGKCVDESAALVLISTDDTLETALRHLSAAVYERRTGDKTGAAHMRAVVAPGSRDVAPSWLVSDATTFSKQEHQRNERVDSEVRWRPRPKGKGKKGDSKGKKGKDKDNA